MRELFEIFYVFAGVGALTFGGGYTMLPLLQKQAAEKRGWADNEQITDFYAVAQCLPGIIAVNTAMLIGRRRKGFAGLLAAALGMVTPSVVVIIVIAAFLRDLLRYEIIRHAFNGIRAAVLALICDAVIKMWKSGVKDIKGMLIFAGALLVFALTGVSPVLPLLAGAACGIILRERKSARAKERE